MKVGIIGLGAMGVPMAQVLLDAGHSVAGFDKQPEANERLAAIGGTVCENTQQLRDCDAMLVMTMNVDQAEASLFDEKGQCAAGEGALVMLTLTMPAARTQALGARLEQAGCEVLDCPVTGGSSGAAQGTLLFLMGGSSAVVARAKPLTDALGKKVMHFGEEIGMGSRAKMINQLATGGNLAVAAEALALAISSGLDKHAIYTVLAEGAGQSFMLVDRGERLLADDVEQSQGSIDIFVKDLAIVAQGAKEAGIKLPVVTAAFERYLAAEKDGLGPKDDSFLLRHYLDTKGGD